MTKIATFDDWIEYFKQWQNDIGYDSKLLADYNFETKLGELHSPEIEFGDFKGQAKSGIQVKGPPTVQGGFIRSAKFRE